MAEMVEFVRSPDFGPWLPGPAMTRLQMREQRLS